MTLAALANLRQANDESLPKFMDRFGHIVVQIHNLNPEVALHSLLLALKPNKFAESLCEKTPSSMDEPMATSRWKKCLDSRTKSNKSDKNAISQKEALRPTHTSQTRGTSQTSASLSQKGEGTSVTNP